MSLTDGHYDRFPLISLLVEQNQFIGVYFSKVERTLLIFNYITPIG